MPTSHSKNSFCCADPPPQCVFNRGYLLVLNILSRFTVRWTCPFIGTWWQTARPVWSHFCLPLSWGQHNRRPLPESILRNSQWSVTVLSVGSTKALLSDWGIFLLEVLNIRRSIRHSHVLVYTRPSLVKLLFGSDAATTLRWPNFPRTKSGLIHRNDSVKHVFRYISAVWLLLCW